MDLEFKKYSYQIINHFTLKIIAIILMTIDHIGMLLFPINSNIYIILRTIGRLALPLFIFMAVEGSFHSKKPYIYVLKFLILGFIIDIGELVFLNRYDGNAFITLGVGTLGCVLVNRKDYYSYLAIPLAILMILADFNFFPLRMDCSFLGLFIFIGIYLGEYLPNVYFNYLGKKLNYDNNSLEIVKKHMLRSKQNIGALCGIFIAYIAFMFLDMFNIYSFLVTNLLPFRIVSYGCLASIIILFYNGKPGYSNKFLNWGFYFYYPLHLCILYGISLLSLCICVAFI